MERVTFNGTARQVAQIIGRLPLVFSGKAPDVHGVARSLQLRVGVAALSQVRQAFLQKADGKTGSDGIKWPPLKPETIARRRTTRAERKALGLRNTRRPSLTPEQDARWRAIFRVHLTLGLRDLPLPEAKARAAAIAWRRLLDSGAKTKKQLLGNRKVEILRDTGQLFNSLSPGVEDRPSGAPGQIFIVDVPGTVIVGTNVKPWHHAGGPRLPARPFWPSDGKIPAAWWPAIKRAAERGIMKAVKQILESGVTT